MHSFVFVCNQTYWEGAVALPSLLSLTHFPKVHLSSSQRAALAPEKLLCHPKDAQPHGHPITSLPADLCQDFSR